MPDPLIAANFTGISSAVDTIQAISRKLREDLTRLEQDAEKNLASWTGEARTEYYVRKGKWDTAADSLNNIFSLGGTKLNDANMLYMRNESNNASGWRV